MKEMHLKKKQKTETNSGEVLSTSDGNLTDTAKYEPCEGADKQTSEHVIEKKESNVESDTRNGSAQCAEEDYNSGDQVTDKPPEEKKLDGAKGENLSTDGPCEWPWIRLFDHKNREYYYNALTSKTSWTTTSNEETAHEKAAKPPTAYSAAQAQKAWQTFWSKCREAQEQSNEMVNSEAGEHGLTEPLHGSSGNLSASMAVYVEHYRSPTAAQLRRGARQQVRPPSLEAVGYVQGYDEYNIWYGKYLSDRRDGNGGGGRRREDREKATTRCNPFTDSGWTRCDMEPPLDRPVICLYFAKGCCYLGSNCRYYHRLPTVEDDKKLDMLHDIFGRERFAAHRDDMDGVGTFSEDCRTLFVGDMKVNRVYSNAEEKTEELIRQQFGLWGPIENIRVIRNKNIAFVRYKYRVHAEFAKVAMAEQRLLLDRSDDQISVRWAHPGRDTVCKTEQDEISANDWEKANAALMKRLEALGYSQEDINCQLKWNIQHLDQTRSECNATSSQAVVSTYPETHVPLQVLPSQENSDPNTHEPSGTCVQPETDEELVGMNCPRLSEALSRAEGFRSEDIFKVAI